MINTAMKQEFLPIPHRPKEPYLRTLRLLQSNRVQFLNEQAETGGIAACHLGPILAVTLSSPEYIQSALVERADDIEKGRSMHRAFTGNGVFISEGDFHTRQRKIMAPSFTPRAITSYSDTMAYYAEKIADLWQDGEEIDLTRAMSAVTTSIVGKTLFDEDVFEETSELGKSLIEVFNHAAYMVVRPFAPPREWPTPRNVRMHLAWRVIRGRIKEMIEDRRAHPKERHDFLSLLMNARDEQGQPMSDRQLIDEAVTLFSGGQETVANAMGWTWFLLTTHPDIYAQLHEETDRVLQGRTPTLTDTKNLPLTLQIFKETLRLYPPAIGIPRQAMRDTVLTNDTGTERYFIKKGTHVLISIYGIHRQQSLFPDPNSFLPATHFTPEHEKQLPRYGYMPFGAGPRICIGNHFAMLEGQLLIATLAQRIHFTLPEGQNITLSSKTLTSRPDTNIRITVHKR